MNTCEQLAARSAARQGLKLWQIGPRVAVTRIAGERGEIEARLMDHGGFPDFIGWFGAGARFLAIEAKSSQHTSRLDLALFRPLQLVRLKRVHEGGGLAAALAALGSGTPATRHYLIPFELLQRFYGPYRAAQEGYIAEAKAPSSIPLAVLDAEAVRVGLIPKTRCLDLVAALQQLARSGREVS